MAGKILKKSVVFILCGIPLILSVCIHPVDIEKFMNDGKVQAIVETSKAKVKIHEDSDDFASLKAESEGISGLSPGNYFRVEEYDKEMVFQRNLFIKANGEHFGNLSQIGRLEGNKIINLTNNYTYKIKKALPFANGTYKYFAFSDTAAREASVTDGAVTIRGAKDYYLVLNPVIYSDKNYEVMQIPVAGTWGEHSRTSAPYKGAPGIVYNMNETLYYPKYDDTKNIGIYQYRNAVNAAGISIQNTSIIALAGIDTQSDYVFAEYDDNKSITGFVVLSVKRLDDIRIQQISLSYSSENSPRVTATKNSISQTENSSIIFTVSNNIYSSYKWYVDGVEQPGATAYSFVFYVDKSHVSHQAAGDYLITVEGVIGGIPYSTEIKITVIY